MSNPQALRLFITDAHPCSYLTDESATTLFLDPEVTVDSALYSHLTLLGFRRSGSHIYRPQCTDCQACIPVRIPVNRFTPSKNMRRVWNKNQDLTVKISPPVRTDEIFALYQRYVDNRHQDGDMYPANVEQFDSFLAPPHPFSAFICFYLHSKLIAVAVNDQLNDGLSAIYTFFDPDFDSRSLGTLAVLWQIKEAQKLGLEHLYLGYWVKECRKMSYKTRFQPVEVLLDDQWHTLAEN